MACYSNMGDSWLRSEVDAALQNDGSASAAIWNLPPEQLSIDKEVTELDGTPAICLIGQITGKEISQALGFSSAVWKTAPACRGRTSRTSTGKKSQPRCPPM